MSTRLSISIHEMGDDQIVVPLQTAPCPYEGSCIIPAPVDNFCQAVRICFLVVMELYCESIYSATGQIFFAIALAEIVLDDTGNASQYRQKNDSLAVFGM